LAYFQPKVLLALRISSLLLGIVNVEDGEHYDSYGSKSTDGSVVSISQ